MKRYHGKDLTLNMRRHVPTDYETYREIMGELLRPISAEGLDDSTLIRLYQSKLVYLENLRVKCFYEINASKEVCFSHDDYELILKAMHQTRSHLRELILLTINNNLSRRVV